MRESTTKLIAANRLRELLCTSLVGDLLHELGDADALDIALKLTQRLGALARAEVDAQAQKS
jgi:hypothetical protein